ncbi:MAG: tetratricopeptide repeat protein [Candidatus Thiodiazotropha sp.]|jgi:predicted negative regulator of RcsB-dependent stress response
MSVYETEEEQVEAIKKWWKENGSSVLIGLVLGLSGVFGWQAWGNYKERIGAEASVGFSQMLNAVQGTDTESALKQAELLEKNYDGTAYAVFGGLAEARLLLDKDDQAAAKAKLESVIKQAQEPSLVRLARLNLARILLDEGAYDEASKLVAGDAGAFKGEYTVLRGDIALANGDKAAAAEAYTQAMTEEVGDRGLLQMKLDDLAVEQSRS